MRNTIDQFMWGYQPHFRSNVQLLARNVFEAIGFDGSVDVVLVGLAREGSEVRHAVCVEPEDGPWPQHLFATLPEKTEEAWRSHSLQSMFFSDPVTSREKPDRIRRVAISDEVARHLRADDERRGVKSFCSQAIPYDRYHVVTVLQLETEMLRAYPLISYRWQERTIESNLVLGCIDAILEQAETELWRPWPEPGRALGDSMRLEAREIVSRAARLLMRTPFVAGSWMNSGLFEPMEAVSTLAYEGRSGTGRILLAAADDPNIDYAFRFEESIPIRQGRWVRKLLQMAGGSNALIADYDRVHGLGRISDVSAPVFEIDIVGAHQWDLRRGDQLFMRVRNGVPRLPQEPVPSDRFDENVRRIFVGIGDQSLERMRNVMKLLLQFGRGSMIIFAKDAASEAKRLDRQGTRIRPAAITHELLEMASAIDGSILADPDGVCHAIGVILDGGASEACTAERGSRYNSAVRYVARDTPDRMAFVISDDGTLDIVPMLRRQVDRAELEAQVSVIETSTGEDYHAARNFLAAHRFYIASGQCQRINAALDRIEKEPREVGQIILLTRRFEPDPEMNDSYFLPED